MELAGRIAIITGASQGLGRSIAEAFVRAGASILLTARNQQQLDQVCADLAPFAPSKNQRLHALVADVSRVEDCQATANTALDLGKGPLVLVNNAGVYGPMGAVEDVDWDAWVATIQTNLFGTVNMCRFLIPAMRKAGYGKIINLSGGGATAPLPRINAYATSKAAVVRFTETIAEELREANVDVNAVAPGALNTRMLDQMLSAGPERIGKQNYERGLKQQQQGGASIERAAALVTMLASAKSDGITGRLISAVWDDWDHLPMRRDSLDKSDIYTLRRITPEDRRVEWKCA